MLIHLSDELRTSDLLAPLKPAACDALINLSTAVHGGKHLVTGSRLTFGRLKQCPELGAVTCDRFKAASNHLTDAEAMRSTVSAYIRVQPIGHPARVEVDNTAERWIFHVPLDHFSDPDRAGSAWLVAEESYDLIVYKALGSAFASRGRGYHCALRVAVGHGGDTHKTFSTLASDSCVICIVDSDRTSEHAPMGNTAADAVKRHKELEAQGKIAVVHVLPCHELENLLPAPLVLASLPTDPKMHQERAKVQAKQACLGLVDLVDLKKLTSPRILEWVSTHVETLTSPKLAEFCCSASTHSALLAVSKLSWSFGLAPKPTRL